jgi:hypothetical protein
MKKQYISPQLWVVAIKMDGQLLQASGVTSDKGIGYGGVDGNGTHEADTRRKSEWDEEPEDY